MQSPVAEPRPFARTISSSPLQLNLSAMELARERYWAAYPNTASLKLRWRALTVRHSFHILPGESILELGAGSGLWTEHLSAALRGRNPITAAIFNDEFGKSRRAVPNTTFIKIDD